MNIYRPVNADAHLNVVADGMWARWGSWGSCSATCGGGHRRRRRHCEFPPHTTAGTFCPGHGTDEEACKTNTCHGMCVTVSMFVVIH